MKVRLTDSCGEGEFLSNVISDIVYWQQGKLSGRSADTLAETAGALKSAQL